MPLKTPSSPPKPSPSGKPKGKLVTPASGKDKNKPFSRKKTPISPPVVSVTWWEALSPERKLDIVGAVMSVVGLLTLLILFSAQRSALTGNMVHLLGQIFGWGIYILPIGLIVMGLWLILRRIEKLPPLTVERGTGILVFFFWLLAMMHAIAIPLELAGQAALDGWGGGYFGSFFQRILFNSLGTGGAVVALMAWLLITATMIFDISVQDLFRWVNPLAGRVREQLAIRKTQTDPSIAGENAQVTSNGFTPLNRPEPVVPAPMLGVPITTVKSPEAIINWQLPDVKNILDPGSAPAVTPSGSSPIAPTNARDDSQR